MAWLWCDRGKLSKVKDGPALSPKVIGPSRELAGVKRRVFERINEDRRRHGVAPVQWDELAAQVGDAHCQEMLEHGYLSHWNLQGYKPYHRYSFAGGTDSVHENGVRQDAGYDMHQTVDKVIASALGCHESMMAERPPRDGHRQNILDPWHTHVGIGLAYSQRGVRMTQEFVHRYMTFSARVPMEARPERTLLLRGLPLRREHRVSSIAIFYEPFPRPMDVRELNSTYAYSLPDEVSYEYPRCEPGSHYSDGSTGGILIHPDGSFECPVRFKRGRPGLYTICVWLQDGKGKGIPATSLTVRVKGRVSPFSFFLRMKNGRAEQAK